MDVRKAVDRVIETGDYTRNVAIHPSQYGGEDYDEACKILNNVSAIWPTLVRLAEKGLETIESPSEQEELAIKLAKEYSNI